MPADPAPLGDEERLARLRLARSEGIGPRTFARLLGHFRTARAALDGMPAMSVRGGRRRPLRPFPAEDAEAELDAIARRGGRLLVCGEPGYPGALAAIADPPPVLTLLGDPSWLFRPSIAMVGARNASAAGMRMARTLAGELGIADLVVVSGMARGIDAAAHDGALATGTVAVLAGGADVAYPRENTALHDRLIERGLVMSEQPFGTQPTARHFPARNRMISGLALGVVVVEATLRSGSLITARLANEQGRQVFAVPGSPLDPRARGTNDLIRQGAILVETAADVVAGLEGMAPIAPTAPVAAEDPAPEDDDEPPADARERLAGSLGATPLTVDELVRECQLSAAQVQTILLELELAGRIERRPGNRVSLVT